MSRIRRAALALVVLCARFYLGATASNEAVCRAAAEDETSAFRVERVAEELDNPCGLAPLPGSFRDGSCELFLSESGAGRIVRMNAAAPQQATDVVAGFPIRSYGDAPTFRMGPAGIAFIAPKKIAVVAEGAGEGQRTLAVFRLPDDGAPMAYDQADQATPLDASSSPATSAEDPFGGVVRVGDALLVAARRRQGEAWIFRASIDANRLAGLQPFIAAEKVTETPGSTALVANPRPGLGYLVGAQMGLAGQHRDSALAFYGPSTGRVALVVPCALLDVVALAYSPSAQLYAADFAWADPASGGVYRIDQTLVDGVQGCRPVKIADVRRPTSLAFTEDGALWVTSFGQLDPQPGSAQSPAPQSPAAESLAARPAAAQSAETNPVSSPAGALFRITGPF